MPKTLWDVVSSLVLAGACFSFALVYIVLGAFWLDLNSVLDWFSQGGTRLVVVAVLFLSIPAASAAGTSTIIAGAIHLQRKKDGREARLPFTLFGISTLLFSITSLPGIYFLGYALFVGI